MGIDRMKNAMKYVNEIRSYGNHYVHVYNTVEEMKAEEFRYNGDNGFCQMYTTDPTAVDGMYIIKLEPKVFRRPDWGRAYKYLENELEKAYDKALVKESKELIEAVKVWKGFKSYTTDAEKAEVTFCGINKVVARLDYDSDYGITLTLSGVEYQMKEGELLRHKLS